MLNATECATKIVNLLLQLDEGEVYGFKTTARGVDYCFSRQGETLSSNLHHVFVKDLVEHTAIPDSTSADACATQLLAHFAPVELNMLTEHLEGYILKKKLKRDL